MWLSIYGSFSIQLTSSDYSTCIIELLIIHLYSIFYCVYISCSIQTFHSIQTLHSCLAFKFLLSSNLYGFSYCLLSMLCYNCVLYRDYTNPLSLACLPIYTVFDYICTLYTIFHSYIQVVVPKPYISLIATHTLLICKLLSCEVTIYGVLAFHYISVVFLHTV